MSRKEEILTDINNFGIRDSWLSEKLGIKKHVLHYLLEDDERIDDELYSSIKEAISEFQYEFHFPGEEFDENYDLFDDKKLQEGIGERIRLFAKRKYGTLKKLAEEMQISPQQLQQYISGNREPGSRILVRLLKLGCDINWVLGGSESFESYKIYKLENELKNLYKDLSQISQIANKTNQQEN